MSVKDAREWRLGQWGESHVRHWLESQGCFVVPTSCIEDGGAPALTRLLERHVLPDFQAGGNGHMGWWEVKTKTRAVFYQIRREFRHGIGRRVWDAYRTVERETGLPGHLAIVQVEPRLLLAAPFGRLAMFMSSHAGSTDAHGEEMVWFALDDFDRYSITPDGPCFPPLTHITPRVVRPWEQGRTMPEVRQPRLWGDEAG